MKTKGFCDTVQDILSNNNAAEHSRYVAYIDMTQIFNDFAEQVKRVLKVPSMIYTFNVDEMPGFADTVWGMQKRLLSKY